MLGPKDVSSDFSEKKNSNTYTKGAMTLSVTTFSITTFSIMALSIMAFIITIIKTRHSSYLESA